METQDKVEEAAKTVRADRPEVELLLWCARACGESERAARLEELLRGEIDWAYVLRMASDHGMEPLLFWHLNAANLEAVPATILDHLRAHFHDNAADNLVVTGELLEIVSLFEEHGITAVPYKGPTLAALAYGNLALREFVDLDVLIHGRDVLKSQELLGTLGYRPRHSLTRAQEAAFLESWGDWPLDRDEGSGRSVELHWPVAKRRHLFLLYPEHVWDRLQPVSLGGGTVSTLASEDLLLVLCVHGSKHSWEDLALICDVARLVQADGGIQWGRLIEQASALGSKRMLLLGLLLGSELLGVALPREISQEIQADPKVETLARQVRERLFVEDASSSEDRRDKRVRIQTFHLKVSERLRDKVQYCFHALLDPNQSDCKYLELPGPLWPLYYVTRPVRLTVKYGKRLLGRLW